MIKHKILRSTFPLRSSPSAGPNYQSKRLSVGSFWRWPIGLVERWGRIKRPVDESNCRWTNGTADFVFGSLPYSVFQTLTMATTIFIWKLLCWRSTAKNPMKIWRRDRENLNCHGNLLDTSWRFYANLTNILLSISEESMKFDGGTVRKSYRRLKHLSFWWLDIAGSAFSGGMWVCRYQWRGLALLIVLWASVVVYELDYFYTVLWAFDLPVF